MPDPVKDQSRLVAIGQKAVEQVSVGSMTKAFMQLGVAAVLAFFLKIFIDGKFEDARWERQQQIESMRSYRDEDSKRQERQWQSVREMRETIYQLQVTLARIESTLRVPPEERKSLPPPPSGPPEKPPE